MHFGNIVEQLQTKQNHSQRDASELRYIILGIIYRLVYLFEGFVIVIDYTFR